MRLDVRLEALAKDVDAAMSQATELDEGSFLADKLDSLPDDWRWVQSDAEVRSLEGSWDAIVISRAQIHEDECADWPGFLARVPLSRQTALISLPLSHSQGLLCRASLLSTSHRTSSEVHFAHCHALH